MGKDIKKASGFENATNEAKDIINLMKTYLGNTPYGFCFIGNNKIVLYINRKVEEITGCSRAEIIGRHVNELEFISSDVMHNIVATSARNRTDENKPLIFEFELVAKDGLKKWIAITVIPINKEGTRDYIGTIVFVFDHSESRNIQEKLQFSDAVLKAIKEGVVIVDRNLIITSWNETCESIFDVKASEVTGRKLFEVIEVISPSPAEIKQKHLNLMSAAICENPNCECLVRVKNKKLWIEAFPQAIKDNHGEIIGGLSIITDITERKKIEESLRSSDAAFKAIKEGVVITDLNFIITDWNDSIEHITGVQSSEAIGKHILDVVEILTPLPSELRKQYRVLEQNDFAGYLSYECLIKTKHETLWVELFPQAIRDAGGEIRGRLFIVTAIDERKRLEEKLRFSDYAFNSIREGIIITGMDGIITVWNEASERIYEIKASDAVGKRIKGFFEIIKPSASQIENEIKRFQAAGFGHFEHLVRVGDKNIWTEVSKQFIKDNNGEDIAVLYIVNDITGRKKIEERLRFTEHAFKSIKEAVVITDMDYKITSWNEASENIFKVKANDATGKILFQLLNIVHPKLAEVIAIKEAIKRGDTINFESLVMVDNKPLWVEVFPHLIKDNEGQDIAVLSIVTNITERKQSEIKLLESEAGLAEAQRIARLGSWQIDISKNEVFWSDELYRLFGYRLGEVTPTSELYFSHVYEDDWKAFEKTLTDDVREGVDIVVRFHRKNGDIWYGHSRSESILDETGEPIALFGSVQDITEQKKTEIKLRESEASLSEAQRMAKLGSWQLDTETGELVWSDEMYRLFGYQPGEVVPTTELFLNAVHPDDFEMLKDTIVLQDVGKESQKTTNIIIRLYRKNGELWFANSKADSAFDASGKAIKHFGSVQDITDIKNAEEREKQMQQELYNATHLASIGEMASGIAHEINNPLTGVVGFSQLLIDRDIPEDIKEDLEIINHEAQRAAKVVSGLLTFAYQNKPGWSMVDVNEIISNTLELRTYEMELSNIQVITELDEHLPLIAADGTQLQQVFLNIILNAEQAMKNMKKRGTLTVGTEYSDKKVVITFADTGPGISKENLPRVFNPFFTTKKVGEGTGLGLSMSHGIIKQHNGKIHVESKQGHGAKFIIELPVTGIIDSIEEKKEMNDNVEGKDSKKGLLIDDEKPILAYLKRLLSGWGYESELVNNAKDALEIMKKNDYDFILLDVKMPDMNGLELYRQLKKMKPELAGRVIFVTGDVLEKTTSTFLKENDVPSITKPIDVEKLRHNIDKILEAE
jgi:PAS domain S-box-containing protein